MLGLCLKSLGEIHEVLKRPEEALKYHLEALECITKIGDHTNLGSVYHHLGNCYSDLGDTTKALDAYKEALKSFYQLGYRQYISNSLGEIGKVVVDAGFSQDLDEFLTEDLLREGLEDVKAEVTLLVATDNRPVEDDIKLLSKLLGVVWLISFTTKARVLKDWAQGLGEEIVAPLLTTDFDDPDFQHETFRQLLNIITSLAFYIGEISLGKEQYTQEQVIKLCVICDAISRWWKKVESFKWLAALLRYRKIYPNVSGQELHDALIPVIIFDDPSKFKI
jgi:tetratricopeptide (TPR) repeat protein